MIIRHLTYVDDTAVQAVTPAQIAAYLQGRGWIQTPNEVTPEGGLLYPYTGDRWLHPGDQLPGAAEAVAASAYRQETRWGLCGSVIVPDRSDYGDYVRWVGWVLGEVAQYENRLASQVLADIALEPRER